MDKKNIYSLDLLTYDGEVNIPYRRVKSKHFGGTVRFAPEKYDNDEWYDEYIYAYVGNDTFYGLNDKEFREYVIKNYD